MLLLQKLEWQTLCPMSGSMVSVPAATILLSAARYIRSHDVIMQNVYTNAISLTRQETGQNLGTTVQQMFPNGEVSF